MRHALIVLILFLALVPPRGCARPAYAHRGQMHVVVTGDNYTGTIQDQARFEAKAATAINAIRNTEPWKSRVDVLDFQIYYQTADLDCKHSTQPGMSRLITCNMAKVTAAVNAAGLDYDHIIVLVKDSTYGGGGGSLTVSGDTVSLEGVIVHEFGHQFGLYDEYNLSSINATTLNPETRVNCWGGPTPPQEGGWLGAATGCRYPNWKRQRVLIAGSYKNSVMHTLSKYTINGVSQFVFTPIAAIKIQTRLDQWAASA